ncbi:hypothetical protein ACM64Y_15100 [Novispirillum sp. DQ9]|uniref:hypothetical protein n=1 Tax=Novispirillum sp. DQ9 TaxID=3398612 RepID=UPI003C7C9935
MTETAPSFRTRLRERRAAAAWWGVLALLVQVLVPLGQAVPVIGADGLPRMLVLCSATPARSVPLPGSLPSDVAQSCAVCLAYGAGSAADLPATPALPFPPAGQGACIDLPTTAHASGLTPGLPQARAPPVIV